ncbi:putative galactose oxidase/kelch, beta-propeller, kelch-type beta propeller [Septoria linicola]|nr:putative galactose oxidase/kelch, beta-propeller, kelch-type beta propeller [Septoria linicola]
MAPSKLFQALQATTTILTFCTTAHTAQPHTQADYQWSPLASLPSGGRQEHAAIILCPDTIGVVGGITPNASEKIPFSSTDLVQLYSIPENTWRNVAPLPQPLNHPNAIGVNGKIYVFGGFDDGDEESNIFHSVADSWVWDSATDHWTALSPLKPKRAQAVLGEYKGRIYMVGGLTDLVVSEAVPLPVTLTHVSVFDIATSSWVTDALPEVAKHLPEPRDHARAEVIDGKMYVIGGVNAKFFNQNSAFILDLENLEAGWQRGAPMPTARSTFGVGVVEGHKIVTIGGEGNVTETAALPTKIYDEVEVYDTRLNSWEQLAPLPKPGRQGPGVGVGGKVYVIGGYDTPPVGPLNRTDVFVLGSDA